MNATIHQTALAHASGAANTATSRGGAVDVLSAAEVPVTRVRGAVANAMTTSAAVPQFSVDREIRMNKLLEFRDALPKTISAADLIHAAIARSLMKHPRLNAAWQGDHLLEFDHVNLGFAVAVTDGLVVPAINCAEQLSLPELSARRRSLSEAATTGSLRPQDVGTATVSVSNLGPTGITGVRPMVIPPQAAIIGLPGPRGDGTISVTLSCDHRVVDGYPAAQFLASLADAIEKPSWMDAIVA